MRTPTRTPARPLALPAALVATMIATPALAQSSWTGATGGEWGTASNWTGGVPNAIGATANIDSALTVNISDTGIGYPFIFGSISTNVASGNVVLGSSATTTDILRAQAGTGQPSFTVTNSGGSIFFYANLEGTQGFTKEGAGKLTFRFNGADQTYTGDIRINAGVLGINQNGSLGDDNNDIFIGNGARLLAEPGSNSGTITLPATRTITLTGAQSQLGSNNAAVNLVINGTITENTAGQGLVKTDAGVVTLAGTVSYTGETRIAGGTLALSGSALLPSGQNLRFNQAAAATLDVGSTHQTVRTIVMDNTTANRTITGAAGSLTVNGAANLELRGSNGITYDFSGLGAFTYNRAASNFIVQPVNAASVTNLFDLNLAKSGSAGGSNTITAAQITIGGGASDGNNGNTARVHLGTINTFNADTISLGGFNAGAVVDFQSGLISPSLKIRGTNGTSAASTVKIGETSSGSRRGEGVLNLTGGTLDALVTNLSIGRHVANANINDTSSLTMPGGTLVATSILLAEKTGTGTPTLTTTLTQGGGSVTTGTLTFGLDAGGGATARLLPTYHLNGGTLRATTITVGGGSFASNSSRNLNLAGGILTHAAGADLSITGLNASDAGRLNLNVTAPSVISADANRTVTIGDHAVLNGSAGLTKSGGGTLLINSASSGYTGTLTVAAGTLGGSGAVGGAVSVGANATLAPGTSIGTLTTGNLSLAGTLELEINWNNSLSMQPASDQVVVNGTVALGGTLQLVSLNASNGAVIPTQTIVIIRNDGSDAVSGTFASIFPLNGPLFSYTIDYAYNADGDGQFNDVAITFSAVPEPSMLGALSLASFALQRRRRRLAANPISS